MKEIDITAYMGGIQEVMGESERWAQRHPVASKRAFDLIESLQTQPEDRHHRIVNLIMRLSARP